MKNIYFIASVFAVAILFSGCTANTSCCVDENGYYNSVCGRYSCTDPTLQPPANNQAGCESCQKVVVATPVCYQPRAKPQVVASHQPRHYNYQNYKDAGLVK